MHGKKAVIPTTIYSTYNLIYCSSLPPPSSDSYGFTAQEAVAIMGAHALGKAFPQDQGYSGSWVKCSNVLTHKYYQAMTNSSLGWAQQVRNYKLSIIYSDEGKE